MSALQTQIAELRHLLGKATPRPWAAQMYQEDHDLAWVIGGSPYLSKKDGKAVAEDSPVSGVYYDNDGDELYFDEGQICGSADCSASIPSNFDPELIVAAINILPDLLDEIERLNALAARPSKEGV